MMMRRRRGRKSISRGRVVVAAAGAAALVAGQVVEADIAVAYMHSVLIQFRGCVHTHTECVCV